jgi:hypothetical protein
MLFSVRDTVMSANGTKQTCSMRSRMSAFGSKPDIVQQLFTNLTAPAIFDFAGKTGIAINLVHRRQGSRH